MFDPVSKWTVQLVDNVELLSIEIEVADRFQSLLVEIKSCFLYFYGVFPRKNLFYFRP